MIKRFLIPILLLSAAQAFGNSRVYFLPAPPVATVDLKSIDSIPVKITIGAYLFEDSESCERAKIIADGVFAELHAYCEQVCLKNELHSKVWPITELGPSSTLIFPTKIARTRGAKIEKEPVPTEFLSHLSCLLYLTPELLASRQGDKFRVKFSSEMRSISDKTKSRWYNYYLSYDVWIRSGTVRVHE